MPLQAWQTAGIRSPVVDHVTIDELRHLQVIDIVVALHHLISIAVSSVIPAVAVW